MDQFGKTTLGSPHSRRNTCPQKEQSIYSNNISKILRWETPTIQHSRVITIPYTTSLPPTPNHLTVISSCQCQHSELHLPASFLLEVPVCQDASPMPKWWHCQHGGNGNSLFSRLPEAQGRRRPFMLRWCWSASSWRRRRCVHGASKHADVSWLGTWNSDPWTLKRNVSINPHLFLLQRVTKYHSLTMTCIILDSKKLWSILLVVCQRLISFGGWGVQYAQKVCCNAAVNQKILRSYRSEIVQSYQVEYQYDKPRVGVAGSGGWVVAINVSAVAVKECRGKRVVTWAAGSDGQDMCQLNMSSSFQLEQKLFPVPSNFRRPISKLYYLYMSISPMYPRYPIIRSNISICIPWPARPP